MTGNVCVLGAGSWGTTLAELLARKGYSVRLWMRSPELVRVIEERRENTVYLPGVRLPEGLKATTSLKETLAATSIVVAAVPSHGLRSVMEEAGRHVEKGAVVVSAAKGIEEASGLTATGIIKEALGKDKRPVVALSGPTFAREVSSRLPAAVCAASADAAAASEAQKAFSTPYLRVYTNSDVTGVEIGGALKNVIAIAAGISDGLGLGNNARAALITRGLAEIARLGVRLGASPQTFSGLSGLGDLVLTCTAAMSRNYAVGRAIGSGKTLAEATGGMRMVAEGVKTSRAARTLAERHSVEMPITEEVCNVLYANKSPYNAVYDLMTRELKDEQGGSSR